MFRKRLLAMPSKKSVTPKPAKSRAKTKVVGFRLNGELERRLAQMAAAAGKRVGNYVLELVLDKMSGGEESQGQELEAMREELEMFREDFATAMEAVLVVASSTGKPLSAEQARRWVNLRLRHLPEDKEGT